MNYIKHKVKHFANDSKLEGKLDAFVEKQIGQDRWVLVSVSPSVIARDGQVETVMAVFVREEEEWGPDY